MHNLTTFSYQFTPMLTIWNRIRHILAITYRKLICAIITSFGNFSYYTTVYPFKRYVLSFSV